MNVLCKHSVGFVRPEKCAPKKTNFATALTSIVIVFIYNPENRGNDLEDVEWMEHLLNEEHVVRLHRNVNGVGSMVD